MEKKCTQKGQNYLEKEQSSKTHTVRFQDLIENYSNESNVARTGNSHWNRTRTVHSFSAPHRPSVNFQAQLFRGVRGVFSTESQYDLMPVGETTNVDSYTAHRNSFKVDRRPRHKATTTKLLKKM